MISKKYKTENVAKVDCDIYY